LAGISLTSFDLPPHSNKLNPRVRQSDEASNETGGVMKIVPVIKSSDLQRSLHFYTKVLDFERKWPGYEDRELANGVIDLVRDGAELQLSRHSGDGVFGSVNRVFVDDVDERYETFRAKGLDTTRRPESPIHTAPVDQTWGLREFAVADPDGNNLCFCMPKR
jgi:catechol 2,3-dioxygenase-like lactoylglutathione lyase family enzyme